MKRISFSERDASHIYEWLMMYWAGEREGKFGGCALCELIGKRLEAMVGKTEASRIERIVRKNPSRKNREQR